MAKPSLRTVEQTLAALVTARGDVLDALEENGMSPAVVDALIAGDDRLDAVGRLNVYANMYFLRLLDVARADFPKLAHALGGDDFAALFAAFIQAHPSRDPSVRHVCGPMETFLANPPAAVASSSWYRPWLGDLARLEWARGEVFDAADADVLTMERLRSWPQDAFAGLPLQLVPAVRTVSVAHAVEDTWRAIDQRSEVVEPAPGPRTLLCWRQDLVVYHRTLDAGEVLALSQLNEPGATFGRLCERLAADEPEVEAAARTAFAWLGRWVTSGILSSPAA